MSNKKAEQRESSKPSQNSAVQKEQDVAEMDAETGPEKDNKAEICESAAREPSAPKKALEEAGSDEAAQNEQLDELKQRIAELEAEKQESKEALLRKQADFENYRRRMQKDKQDAIQFANRSLIGDLLEVLDNFERALLSHREQKETSAETKSLFDGLELVEKQLSDLLYSRGLKAIESLGAEFDPNVHEALMMEEGADYEVPTVVENFQTGYMLHGRVLRPARVKIAKPAS